MTHAHATADRDATVRVVLLQSAGATNAVIFDSAAWAVAQQQQHPAATAPSPPSPTTTAAVPPLPLSAGDLRDMVLGVLPTTADADVTKLHVVPLPSKAQQPRQPSSSSSSSPAGRLVALSKLFVCKAGPPPSHSPSFGDVSGAAQHVHQRKVTMALAVLLLPRAAGGDAVQFVGTHFLVLDVRLCKAVRRLREHMTALLVAAARRQFAARTPPPPSSSLGLRTSTGGRAMSASPGAFGARTPPAALSPSAAAVVVSLLEDDIVAGEVCGLRDTVLCLLNGPRLVHPLWSHMMLRTCSRLEHGKQQQQQQQEPQGGHGVSPGRRIVAQRTPEAVRLLERIAQLAPWDTARANNFVSAAVTAVLASHRAWVSTISDSQHRSGSSHTGSTMFRNFLAKQLWDLQGGPLGGALSRAVVVCDDHAMGKADAEAATEAADALLEVLSFFLRSPALRFTRTAPSSAAPSVSPLSDAAKELGQVADSSTAAAASTEPSTSDRTATTTQPQAECAELEEVPLPAVLRECFCAPISQPAGGGGGDAVAPQAEDCEDTAGPGLTLFGGMNRVFRADFVLLGVRQHLPFVLDALADELLFEWDLHGEFLAEGDRPTAVVADMATHTVELVAISPPQTALQQQQGDISSDMNTPLSAAKKPAAKGTPQALRPMSPPTTSPLLSGRGANMTVSVLQRQYVATECVTRSVVFPAARIVDTFATVRSLWALGTPADACVMFLEDRLHELCVVFSVLFWSVLFTHTLLTRNVGAGCRWHVLQWSICAWHAMRRRRSNSRLISKWDQVICD